jgi:hypothetical protein
LNGLLVQQAGEVFGVLGREGVLRNLRDLGDLAERQVEDAEPPDIRPDDETLAHFAMMRLGVPPAKLP